MRGAGLGPFKEAYEGWHAGELTQTEAARLLGMCERSFRRYLARYEEFYLQGLIDKRIEQVTHRRAPVDEVMKLVSLYSTQYGSVAKLGFSSKIEKLGP